MSLSEQTFEQFWSDCIDYANEVNVSLDYLQDEFILEGELYCVSVQFEHPTREENY